MLFNAHAVTLSPAEQFLLDVLIVSLAIGCLIFTDNKNKSRHPGLIFAILAILACSVARWLAWLRRRVRYLPAFHAA